MNKDGRIGGTTFRLIALVLTLALIVGGTMLYERTRRDAEQARLEVLEESLDTSPWTDENTVLLDDELYGFDHRLESYLFIGTDENAKSLSGSYQRAMADFLLLMVMDHTDNSYGFIQIDRNTITNVSELDESGNIVYDRELQVCTAQWYGTTAELGAKNTVDAVRLLLGELENIDGYYEISMKDIAALNRAVGGVKITFDEDLTAADPAFVKGASVTLDDAQAEAFLRARMSVGQGTNVERMDRQWQYMSSLLARVREHTAKDPRYGLELWNALRSIAVTDMIGNDFSRIAQKLLKGQDKGILRLEGKTRQGKILGDGLLHEEFYPTVDSIVEVMTELYSLVLADPDDVKPDIEDEFEDETEDEVEDEEIGEYDTDEPEDDLEIEEYDEGEPDDEDELKDDGEEVDDGGYENYGRETADYGDEPDDVE